MIKTKNKGGEPSAKVRLVAGKIIDLTIADLNEEGLGQACHEGMPVLVNGVLPGETVRAKITYSGRREAFADAVKILRHSPDRLLESPCAKPLLCNGCPLISMNYRAQLAWKKRLVADEMARFSSLRDLELHDVIASQQPFGYRTSAKLVIGGNFADPRIGIYRRNSHTVVDIGDCPLHHPLINRVVHATKAGITKGKVPVYSPRSGTGLLRYLVVRVAAATNRVMVVFVTAWRSFNEIHHLAKFVRERVPEVEVVVQNVNSSSGNVIMGQKDFFATRRQTMTEQIGDHRFTISPRSFFQVNPGGARTLYETVREWGKLQGTESVIDLYCGVGGISLFLAPWVREVFGIEVVESAVMDAEANARLNGINNCEFAAGDATELFKELIDEGRKPDLVVLNPPRKGCDSEVLQQVAAIGPAKIIYVSCSPRTLARDLHLLSGSGYRTVAVQPVDMFPQTPHVENVALLQRR